MLLVDDHPLFREAVRARLASATRLQVVGEAASSDEALAQIRATQPHLAVIDIRLGKFADVSGLVLARTVRARHPETSVLIYEARDVKDQLAETMEYAGQQSLELGEATAALAEYQRSIDATTALGKLGEEQLAYSRAGRGRALAAAHRDADAIGELEWAISYINGLPKPGHRTLANSRLALADALWRRAQPGDRMEARVEAGKAYKDALARRADLDAHDPQTPLERRVDDQLAARIAAWQANHR